MKIVSWNVNGLRAVWNKEALQRFVSEYSPDILCVQEIKCEEGQLTAEQKTILGGYTAVFESAKNRKGYSGVAIYVKAGLEYTLLHSTLGKHGFYDEEGRTIVIECKNFYLINCYFPNGGKSSEHYEYKLEYYKHFLQLAQDLEKNKPVIWCGDVNATNGDIDLARPKENRGKLGCSEPERKALAKFSSSFIDTYRYIHGERVQYTWWDMKTRSREKGVGWRIDYMYTSEGLKNKIKNAYILDEVLGSDHCPIVLEVSV